MDGTGFIIGHLYDNQAGFGARPWTERPEQNWRQKIDRRAGKPGFFLFPFNLPGWPASFSIPRSPIGSPGFPLFTRFMDRSA